MGGKGSDKDAVEFAVENGFRPDKLVRGNTEGSRGAKLRQN